MPTLIQVQLEKHERNNHQIAIKILGAKKRNKRNNDQRYTKNDE